MLFLFLLATQEKDLGLFQRIKTFFSKSFVRKDYQSLKEGLFESRFKQKKYLLAGIFYPELLMFQMEISNAKNHEKLQEALYKAKGFYNSLDYWLNEIPSDARKLHKDFSEELLDTNTDLNRYNKEMIQEQLTEFITDFEAKDLAEEFKKYFQSLPHVENRLNNIHKRIGVSHG